MNVNFFEWGISCKEFENQNTPILQPIYEFSFQWKSRSMITYSSFIHENPGVIHGIGEYQFEMRTSQNQAKVQEIFRKQKVISEVAIIRLANQNGTPSEVERYAIKQAVIKGYEFISNIETGKQIFRISLSSNGNDEFIQTVHNNEGLVMGKRVSAANEMDTLITTVQGLKLA